MKLVFATLTALAVAALASIAFAQQPPQYMQPVNPNAYGPGMGADQYGRPVRPRCNGC